MGLSQNRDFFILRGTYRVLARCAPISEWFATIQLSDTRMIFRKEPLIDAEWLLGPTETTSTAHIRKDICGTIMLATIAIVAGWMYLSNFVLASRRPRDLTAKVTNKDSGIDGRWNIDAGSPTATPQLASIDESLIRTVDRSMPKSPMDVVNESQSSNPEKRGRPKEIRLPVHLPFPSLNSAIEAHFAIADLRIDANPTIPLGLLDMRVFESNETDSASSANGDQHDVGKPGKQDSYSDRPTRVVRTVAYTGKLSLGDKLTVRSAEPEMIVSNASKLASNSISVGLQPGQSDQLEDSKLQVFGLENRSNEEVIRLLASVQPRLAGAALNELKRRNFDESQLHLAIELASGRTEARIAALDKLVSEQSIAPLPWLVWMAEDEDRQIREHAIRLLASIPSEQARVKMRLLSSREKDARLRDLLRQSILSSGAVLSSREGK